MYALPLPSQFPTYQDWPRASGSWYRMPYQYPVSGTIDETVERLKIDGTGGERKWRRYFYDIESEEERKW